MKIQRKDKHKTIQMKTLTAYIKEVETIHLQYHERETNVRKQNTCSTQSHLLRFHGNDGTEGHNEGMDILHVEVVSGHSI